MRYLGNRFLGNFQASLTNQNKLNALKQLFIAGYFTELAAVFL